MQLAWLSVRLQPPRSARGLIAAQKSVKDDVRGGYPRPLLSQMSCLGFLRRPVRPPRQRQAVVDRGVLQEVPGEGRVHRQALRQLHRLQPRGGWLLSDLRTNGEATEIYRRWTRSVIGGVLSVQVNGRLTLGENIADMGGLKLSYYVSYTQEK